VTKISEYNDQEVSAAEVIERLQTALERRGELRRDADLDAWRVFHGWSEGVPGLVIDRYGTTLIGRAQERCAAVVEGALDLLAEELSTELAVAKVGGSQPRAIHGTMPSSPVTVCEHGARFLVEPWQKGNPGLHLDARPARSWIRQNSRDRRILNLFSFTGSLGLVASLGGALSVTHVDMQAGVLSRCRANYRLNGMDIDSRDLMRVNIYQHLRKAKARRRKYHGIIVDPPPYTKAIRSDRTPGGRGMAALCEALSEMLEPGAWMLCFFHHSESSHEEHEAEVLDAAQSELEILWRGTSGEDFPEREPNRKLRLTAFVRPQSAR
jgi:23S rRNA (cytosine1962-C5)-methyltransferase